MFLSYLELAMPHAEAKVVNLRGNNSVKLGPLVASSAASPGAAPLITLGTASYHLSGWLCSPHQPCSTRRQRLAAGAVSAARLFPHDLGACATRSRVSAAFPDATA